MLAAVGAYEAMRLALRPDWPLALEHARRIAAFERVAHLAWELPLQRAVLTVPPLVEGMNVFYLGAHFLGDGAVLRLALPALATGVPPLPQRLPGSPPRSRS